MACGILVPWSGIELVPSVVEVQSGNCWTAREDPSIIFLGRLPHPLSTLYLSYTIFLHGTYHLLVKVTQLCLTLCNPMDYTVHGILQARILKWVAIPFSKRSSQPRDRTQVSHIAGRFFTKWATRGALSPFNVLYILVFCCSKYSINMCVFT